MKWKRPVSDIQRYIRSFLSDDNSLLSSVAEEYEKRDDTLPSIDPEGGKLIGLLIRSINARHVMEFGTCLGYSTIWLAEAMKATNGKLTAIEYDLTFYNDTKHNIEKAGLASYVELIHGDASKIIQEVEGPFDIILQDSEKSLYCEMFDRCVELIRPGGLIIADDTLFAAMGLPKPVSVPMDEYNNKVFADDRLYTTIIPIGDGMTVSYKK